MKLQAPTAPALYTQEGVGVDAIVHAHYFLPGTGADWYVTEYEPASGLCFGWAEIVPGGGELGYFTLNELETAKAPVNLAGSGIKARFFAAVEYDTGWKPRPLRDVLAERQQRV